MTNPLVSSDPDSSETLRHRQAVQIVGMGASAGGLDAISEFLASMPTRTGMAFIVLQHQDPSRRGLLPELLRRITSMEVCEIAESIEVRPDHVYVAPPNHELAFSSEKLMPVETAEAHARYPIDSFFRALAAEKGQAAAGVVFSGMGTDGTAGLRAIQEAGGVTLAQEPNSAKFDSMPRSAITAGVADFVAPPGAMPMWLCQVRSVPHGGAHGAARARRQALRELMSLLQRHTGNNFTEYKMSTVLRRIERRMKLHQLDARQLQRVVYPGSGLRTHLPPARCQHAARGELLSHQDSKDRATKFHRSYDHDHEWQYPDTSRTPAAQNAYAGGSHDQ
ncbi:chemotaxis protein CheB [Pseudoduganella sp. R-43]|uniref:chemotaxis protein CheB n=1 Tax=unclassified Pseudoduganella TaxID=2637179 RepID=UPI003CF6D49B